MKHYIPQTPSLPQATRHPTPAQIRGAIADAFFDDFEKNDGSAPIPARALRIVNDAISRVCDAVSEGKA